jgi:predicted helicase
MGMRAKIFYFTLQDEQTKEEKLGWFERVRFEQIPFDHIAPDKKANWINLTDNDFDSFLPLIDKEVKAERSQEAVFQLFSRGLETGRDEWVYDFSETNLISKMEYIVRIYKARFQDEKADLDIKWDRQLDKYIEDRIEIEFDFNKVRKGIYRPFSKQYLYFDKHLNRMPGQALRIFPESWSVNQSIGFMGQSAGKPFAVIVTNLIPDLNCISPASGGTQCLPLYPG